MSPSDREGLVSRPDSLHFNNPIAQRATLGEATSKDVWDQVRRRFALLPEELDAPRRDTWAGGVWNTALLDSIRALRPRCKTGTIGDGWPDARQAVKGHVNSNFFDVSVLSAEEDIRKPSAEIYRRALSRLGEAPQEAVFVDDRLRNVEGARQMGMHATHCTDSLRVRAEIRRLIGTKDDRAII